MGEEKVKANNSYGITGFILSLIGFFLFLMPYFAIFLSILGVVFGSLQAKRGQTGLGTTAIVLGILGIVGNLFWLLIVIAMISAI